MVVYVYKSLWIRVQYKLKKTCTVGCGKSNVGIKKLSVQHTLLLIRDNRNDFEYTYDLANDEIRHPFFTFQALFCFILKYREGFFFMYCQMSRIRNHVVSKILAQIRRYLIFGRHKMSFVTTFFRKRAEESTIASDSTPEVNDYLEPKRY